MRTNTAVQRAAIKAPGVNHYCWVEVENADRTYKDLTNLGGVDWVDMVEVSESIDQPVGTFTINLRRDTNALSTAPTMGGSTLNRNNAGAYAPLLDPGRNVKIYMAAVPPGVIPSAGDKKLLMQGRIDIVNWKSNPVVCTGRDLGGWIVDAFIKVERPYATGGPTAIETVMAAVLAADPVFGSPTLSTPVSPGFLINNTTGAKQAKKSIMEALQQDFALALGWVCRYRFDASDNYNLTFFDVNRANTTAMDSFSPNEYQDITNIEVSDADVRNYIVGTYYDSGGHLVTRTVQNATSQGKYGVKYMEINLAQGDPINTNAQMDTMLNAAVNDLGSPLTTQEMQTWLYWPVQIGDLYTFVQNSFHYDSDQKLAVIGFTHRFQGGKAKTVMQCRGSVIGAFQAWFRRGPGAADVPAPTALPAITDVSVGFPAGSATVEIVAKGSIPVGSWRVALSTSSQPSAATIRAAPVYAGQNIDQIITQTVYTGQRLYIGLFAYTGSSGTGAESAQWDSSIVRDGTGGKALPIPMIYLTDDNASTATVGISAQWSPGAPPPLEYRYLVTINRTFPVWGAWQSAPALPQVIGTITRHLKMTKIVMLQVRQGSDDTTIAQTTMSIGPSMPLMTEGGVFDRAVAASDSNYSLAGNTTDSTGLQANAGTIDSTGRDIRRAFAKVTYTDSDNADYLIDGSARRVPLLAHLNSVGTLLSRVDYAAGIGDNVALILAKASGTKVFREVFDQLPTTQGYVDAGYGLGTQALVPGLLGVTSTNVLQITGQGSLRFPYGIPYNPALLYRVRVRYRCTVDATTGSIPGTIYVGLGAFDTAGVFRGIPYNWNVILGVNLSVAAGWVTVTTWFKGLAGAGNPLSVDPLAPAGMPSPSWTTGYICPTLLANYSGSNSVTQFDFIEIDAFEEEATPRTYSALDTYNGSYGRTLATTRDSTLREVRRAFAKSVYTDSDDLGFVPDGTSYKKVANVNGSNQITPTSSVGRNRCKAYHAAGAQSVTDSTDTKLTFDSELYDVGALHSTVTNPGRITIPTGGNVGIWQFVATVSWDGVTVGGTGTVSIRIKKNNATYLNIERRQAITPTAAGYGDFQSVVAFDDAPTVGDYYEVEVHQTSGATRTIGSGVSTLFTATHLW